MVCPNLCCFMQICPHFIVTRFCNFFSFLLHAIWNLMLKKWICLQIRFLLKRSLYIKHVQKVVYTFLPSIKFVLQKDEFISAEERLLRKCSSNSNAQFLWVCFGEILKRNSVGQRALWVMNFLHPFLQSDFFRMELDYRCARISNGGHNQALF